MSRPRRCRPLQVALLAWLAAMPLGSSPVAAQVERPLPNGAVDLPPVVEVEVRGARSYDADQLRAALGQPLGAPLDPNAISEGMENLWQSFRVRGRVTMVELDGGVRLILTVRELPYDLEPRFIGNDKIATSELLEWALLVDREELFVTEIPRVTHRILEGYRQKGFLFAEVHPRWGDPTLPEGAVADPEEAQDADVIFEILEGPVVRVGEVELHGSDVYPRTGMLFWKDGLAHQASVKQKGPSLFNWFGSRYVREEFAADLLAMRTVLRDRGYLDAIVELEREEFNEERSRVRLHVVVDEGERYTVRSLDIEAVDLEADPRAPTRRREVPADLVLPKDELLALLELEPGGAFEKSRQREDERRLRDHYGARGYLSHPSLGDLDGWLFLEPHLLLDVEKREVDVTYRIAQGRKRLVREILLSGTTHTRDRVLRREITQLPGEVADLGEIQRSRQRIAATGFFSDPSDPLGHVEPDFRFRVDEENPDEVDVEFFVDEGQVVDFQVAGGIDSNNGAFGLISLSMRNFDLFDPPRSLWSAPSEVYDKQAFHGAGQRLDVQLSPGSEINFWRVRFLEPDLFRTHFRPWLLDLEAGQRERIFRLYDEERTTARARFGHKPYPDLTVSLGILDQAVTVDDIDDPPVPQQLVDQDGRNDLNALTLDATFRRLDSAFSPREGFEIGWSSSWYDEAWGSDFEFVKSSLEGEVFLPVGDPLADVRPSLRIAGGIGVAAPVGTSDFVPYSERFFLGGFRTLRGFAFRGVGPNVGSNPIGGETYFNGSVEYRLPIHSVTQPGSYREVEMFRFIPFVDFGNLGPEKFALDEEELRVSAGFGFGLANPFPLVINFGFPLRKGRGDDLQVFSFNLALR